MGYPIYKLLRAVNRQYPNNGFINYVDVREDMYDTDDEETNKLIDEDLRDLINETLQEVYIHIARDEVYSFPTVPGQREYVLPDDCDLRDIQEVTRTFRRRFGPGCPPPPSGLKPTFSVTFYANGGIGTIEPIEAEIGETITLPECTFIAPGDDPFSGWDIGGKLYQPGDTVSMYADLTAVAMWGEEIETFPVQFTINPIAGNIGGEQSATYYVQSGNTLASLPTITLNEGFQSRGFSKDGVTPISDSTILSTPVTGPVTYTVLTNSINYTVRIYISTVGGTGVLHYTPVGGTATERTMTYGGTPFVFTLNYSQTIADIFTELKMYDDTNSVMVVNLINRTITGDTDIPVAVPTVRPDSEQSGSNNDGGNGDNPIGGGSSSESTEPQDPGRDPESSSDESSGGAEPQDPGRDPE